MLFVLAANAAAEEPEPFPPFDPWHWPSQAFWLLVTFGLLYLVMSRAVLPRLAATVERRESSIAADLDEAARLSDEAKEAQQALEQELARARSKARETAAAAQAKVEATVAEATRKADAELETKLEAAEARIAETRQQAMTNVETIAAGAAQAMLARLGKDVDASEAADAVKRALS